MGLREIADAISLGKISQFTYEEVERIVEARFEKTQLRDSIMRNIAKEIQNRI